MEISLDCAGKPLDLEHTCVMGILNVTPDSFSDGGDFLSVGDAVTRGLKMVEQGADIVDVGGESTRPGAKAVSERDELTRIIPVIKTLAQELPVPISVDTSKPGVMRAAVDAGAGLINDVLALCADGAMEEARRAGVPVCLMHMQGNPRTMQTAPCYEDVVAEIKDFFKDRIEVCIEAGIESKNLVIDPGFGFGKTLEHNLTLLCELSAFGELGIPMLVGMSRKSMLGVLLHRSGDERLYGSVAAAVIAALSGANIVRVHDVAETVQALMVVDAVKQEKKQYG